MRRGKNKAGTKINGKKEKRIKNKYKIIKLKLSYYVP
jgi:hypothetical protein